MAFINIALFVTLTILLSLKNQYLPFLYLQNITSYLIYSKYFINIGQTELKQTELIWWLGLWAEKPGLLPILSKK